MAWYTAYVVENIDSNSLPISFEDKEINAITRRIVMKLRENAYTKTIQPLVFEYNLDEIV